MQANEHFISEYPKNDNYEKGTSRNSLTGTDTMSWHRKSWVIGIKENGFHTVFDWNELKQKRILEKKMGDKRVFVVLSKDQKSFFGYENTQKISPTIHDDIIQLGSLQYTINGKGMNTKNSLKEVNAYQEFWHSWSYFMNQKN